MRTIRLEQQVQLNPDLVNWVLAEGRCSAPHCVQASLLQTFNNPSFFAGLAASGGVMCEDTPPSGGFLFFENSLQTTPSRHRHHAQHL